MINCDILFIVSSSHLAVTVHTLYILIIYFLSCIQVKLIQLLFQSFSLALLYDRYETLPMISLQV